VLLILFKKLPGYPSKFGNYLNPLYGDLYTNAT